MTTKPSAAPWADAPHALIPTPHKHSTDTSPWIDASSNISQAHNFLLRGLNSIIQQAPQIPPDAVKSFAAYSSAFAKLLTHHYWVQEKHVFAQFEAVAARPGLLDGFRDKHRRVEAGVAELQKYLDGCDAQSFSAREMLAAVDGFAKVLVDDLHDEVRFFAEPNKYDSEAQAKLWADSLREAKQEGNLAMMSDIVPFVLGNSDLTYEGGTGSPFPVAMPYAVQYWFALGNDAWQFCPCDFFGQPRPLKFGPPAG